MIQHQGSSDSEKAIMEAKKKYDKTFFRKFAYQIGENSSRMT